jgi:integrase
VLLLDQFLQWVKENRAPRTFDWYYGHLQPFAHFIGPKRAVGEIKPILVTRWLATLRGGDTWKNGAARAVSRAFNWGQKQGLIPFSPVHGMEKPTAEHRKCYITGEQWANVLELVRDDDPAKDILVFLHETGARPIEARIASVSHLDQARDRLIFEVRRSKGKRDRRVIRLNQTAREIVKRLALKHGGGPLFRNRRGEPWSMSALNQFFIKLSRKAGFKIMPYSLRHTFCSNSLLRGVDPMSVAILMGHRDATMVMRVYGHLTQNDEFLETKLKQATGETNVA